MKEKIEVKNLDHLGIIAGIVDEIGIESIVNESIGIDKREKISAGKIVKAIILNGLGMLSKPLYLFPQFFQDKPVEKLLGTGIQASEINDDKIGRVMDSIREYGLEKLWLKIAFKVIKTYHIKTDYSHLDSTSISVEGEYKDNSEGTVNIGYGFSKDKRPDLKQFIVNLLVSQDGDIPLLINIRSGNESDKKQFAEIIKAYQQQINWSTIYIADSALYTADNLHKLGKTPWISRVPLNNKRAKQEVENLEKKELRATGQEGYRYHEKRVNHHGIEQRWQLIESESRKKADLDKLEKALKTEKEKIEKKLRNWQKIGKKSESELKLEVKQFSRQLKYHRVNKICYKQQKSHAQKIKIICECTIEEKPDSIEREKKKAGRFIIATNVLDVEKLPSSNILQEYKAQQGCERSFRFIKDPLFLADTVYLKNPQRIETLSMLIGLCLLVYNLGQRILRLELKYHGEQIRNNNNQLTSTPTLRWVFQMFQGIHIVKIKGESIISGITDELLDVLKYFTGYCQKYYGLNA
jgi:transposase